MGCDYGPDPAARQAAHRIRTWDGGVTGGHEDLPSATSQRAWHAPASLQIYVGDTASHAVRDFCGCRCVALEEDPVDDDRDVP